MSSSSSRFSNSGLVLCAASLVVLGASFLVWETRSQAALNESRNACALPSSTGNQPKTVDSNQLLSRSFIADKTLSFSADSQTTAMYGERKMQTRAHLMRAPRRLTITYLSGDRRGLEAGYNERWFWRRDGKSAPMQAYAEVALRPDEMATQRFALAMSNYRGAWLKTDNVSGRTCNVVELRRKKPLKNARGPFKRLWIDTQSGLTLRTDAFNCNGDLVLRSVLSNVKVDAKMPTQAFVAPSQMIGIARRTSWTNQETGSDRAKVRAATGIAPPQPSWLPEGFAFDSVGMHNTSLAKGATTAALARYSDGLNVVTIFAFKTAKPAASQSESAFASGAKSPTISCIFGAGTMAMRETPDGLSLIAIGDLPTPMLTRILDSVATQ